MNKKDREFEIISLKSLLKVFANPRQEARSQKRIGFFFIIVGAAFTGIPFWVDLTGNPDDHLLPLKFTFVGGVCCGLAVMFFLSAYEIPRITKYCLLLQDAVLSRIDELSIAKQKGGFAIYSG